MREPLGAVTGQVGALSSLGGEAGPLPKTPAPERRRALDSHLALILSARMLWHTHWRQAPQRLRATRRLIAPRPFGGLGAAARVAHLRLPRKRSTAMSAWWGA